MLDGGTGAARRCPEGGDNKLKTQSGAFSASCRFSTGQPIPRMLVLTPGNHHVPPEGIQNNVNRIATRQPQRRPPHRRRQSLLLPERDKIRPLLRPRLHPPWRTTPLQR